jgi:predicted RNA-binding Zn-ribbon protein involved in translation (DUF1610 family)
MDSDEKFRRTALRRAVDNRLPAVAKTPVSDVHYLVAHACFDCRKSFKVAPRPQQSKCPNCGNPLHWMGRSFKTPAARDREQWAKVQALYLAGFRFFSYRRHDCAPLPLRLAEVDEFIRNNPEHPFRVGNSE